jgi:BASS family bile acid:Na+ symporter
MNRATLVRTLILASMALLVVSLGLRSTAGDAEYLFRRPRLLVQSVVAMYVVMPLVVIGLVMQLGLRPPVKIALAALALSPVPPFLPGKQLKLASCEGYIYGLLVAASVLAIVLVPAVTAYLAAHIVSGPHVRAGPVLRIVALTVFLPLAAGMSLRRLWPERAPAWAPPLHALGTVLLIVGFLPVLVAQWGSVRSVVGDGTLLAIVVATCIGLLVGHVLGGPDPRHRTVLALATASRHPGVALAIASAGFPDQKLVPAAVLLAVLVGVGATAPYSAWRARVHPVSAPAKADSPVGSSAPESTGGRFPPT